MRVGNYVKVEDLQRAAKWFKKTGSGFKRKRMNKNHILTKKTTKRKRHLRGTTEVHAADVPAVKRMLKEI